MAFTFGPTPKSATGFTLPTTIVAGTSNTAYSLSGGGDLSTPKTTESKPILFGTPFSLGTQNITTTTSAPTFSLGTTSAPLSFGVSSTTATTTSTGFSLGTALTTTTPSLNFGSLGGVATSTAAPAFPLGGLSAGTALTTTTSTLSALPATGTLTFAQLEDAVNKWALDLEEQGKTFGNQARHLNAWDRLLISNGEKILGVSNGLETIKQQQQQLDQDLDFVLAQQKELEDCIAPLEKELQDIIISDVDRNQTYKLAENIDTQLKQMSEDLKEIIEHLNESNKAQELSDPVSQIGRILNAHMNSLQWIDRNTSQISAHLDEISKMHDMYKKNHETLHGA
ncbi:hypothetical protein RN001_001397 [Aquatica leii]|uniref:Nucleoporin NSP1-like C-terminal domain-containing protein n=1 Tax=Aquatica leii TaxID=1421715 RepID=A0AAN7PNI0_9COLE|nr:hypothetical protein RN001_001397 [Aquatica leii]